MVRLQCAMERGVGSYYLKLSNALCLGAPWAQRHVMWCAGRGVEVLGKPHLPAARLAGVPAAGFRDPCSARTRGVRGVTMKHPGSVD